MYKRTLVENGQLSKLNANIALVNKLDAGLSGECRVTFKYRNMKEDLPDDLGFMLKMHDYLSQYYDHNIRLRFEARLLGHQHIPTLCVS